MERFAAQDDEGAWLLAVGGSLRCAQDCRFGGKGHLFDRTMSHEGTCGSFRSLKCLNCDLFDDRDFCDWRFGQGAVGTVRPAQLLPYLQLIENPFYCKSQSLRCRFPWHGGQSGLYLFFIKGGISLKDPFARMPARGCRISDARFRFDTDEAGLGEGNVLLFRGTLKSILEATVSCLVQAYSDFLFRVFSLL